MTLYCLLSFLSSELKTYSLDWNNRYGFSDWVWLTAVNKRTFPSSPTSLKKKKKKKFSLRELWTWKVCHLYIKRDWQYLLYLLTVTVQFLNLVWLCFCSLWHQEKTWTLHELQGWTSSISVGLCAVLRICLHKNMLQNWNHKLHTSLIESPKQNLHSVPFAVMLLLLLADFLPS